MTAESDKLEFKQSLAEWREVVESVAALATVRGGEIRIGVRPDGSPGGIQLGHGTLEDLANKIKLNTDPSQYPTLAVEGPEASAIIRVQVEESPIKPVCAFGRPLKRVGKTNQHIARGEVQRMMERTTGRTWDALECPGSSLEELDEAAVNYFLALAGMEAGLSHELLLKNLGLLSEAAVPCRGAVLLFARQPQRFIAEAQVKCARFDGTTSISFLDERTLDGTLLFQLNEALAFVARNTRQALRITGRPARDVVPEYPAEAVREALVNALCHRDYATTGTVQVRIYDDRLEVWNPGHLPPELSLESLQHEHPSHPHNPRLAQALYRARLIEHWGTGTLRIIKACASHGIAPEFLMIGGDLVVRFRQSPQLVPIEAGGLTARQQKAVAHVRERGGISNLEYQRLVGVSERQALKDLRALVALGKFVRAGRGRTTRYEMRAPR